MASCAGISVGPARRWVLEHIRVLPSKVVRWSSRVNCKRQLSKAKLEWFQDLSVSQLTSLVQLRSLTAHVGAWKLPLWPSRRRLCSQLRTGWSEWWQGHRLPVAVGKAAPSSDIWLAGAGHQLTQEKPPCELSKTESCHQDWGNGLSSLRL